MLAPRRLLQLVVAILLLLPVLAGCSAGSATAEPYKIGALFAVTGNNSPLGTPEKETAQLLEEQINAKGGI
ncbi:MAG: ABC transporter substrate-binding protein, partial [Chloroflexi bacterium]|nr:ABC transporter substrate-binding protein [Chloroflexota bacterium]